ncbi:putative Luciferase-like [Vibrio nigripulchritudo SFn27]|uniref:Putative Luciferase-like n=1 Tax=Vibrio nigripulchritudo TaxID=28173 RepID=U4KC43_9VIBR|nr:NtaA/DmoA family FMN-dependent monooxygenase [Vibrio nigripulchritudo]CCN80841.1 putative Luciferase-like [Vibrio nigripulchritudo BLFn1]CCN88043.1 putative Luciferase-like [Vibrio nigripulchritudo SFn27]CCN96897.1 putative Luciferase-like [Vibrio nigripulchritudo ENn2]CCO43450.1 putative Luciferase-like [Vibrio nigripulchritudo SFn135]CCO51645.1 putative Luciferase-like [Vibrio nigripulchritudo Wn13]
MKENKQLCVGMALAASWMTKNGWRRSNSGIEDLYSTDFYVELAKKAEKAKLDFLFRPDTLFVNTAVLDAEPGFSSLDPMVLIATLARETEKIGLISTASTTYNPPYVVARQLQSLNWITKGRIGWNVVTAIDGNKNFGEDTMMSSEEKYIKAEEFTKVVQELWQSYPYDSLIMDKKTGHYADKSQISPIEHKGDYFSVEGPLNVPGHPSGSIPLFQAGSSNSGRNFASRVADAVFAATPDIEAGIELRKDLRKRAETQGRNPDQIKVFPGISLYLAETKEEAEELYQETHAQVPLSRKHNYVKEAIGLDISLLSEETIITPDMLPKLDRQVRSKTHSDLIRRLIEREQPTVAELLKRPEVAGSSHWLVVGTPEDAFKEIKQRFQAGAADGIIAVPGGSIESMNLFFEELMPMLSQSGLFKKEYTGNTLREHLNSYS